jgi:tetratricopeptide (TPR) repeat protein
MEPYRFKNVRKVAIVATTLLSGIIFVPLVVTGILPSLIKLPSLENEAIRLGAPKNLEEYKRFIGDSGRNIAPDLKRLVPSHILLSDRFIESHKADPKYVWPKSAQRIFNKLQPNISEIEALKSNDYLCTSDLPTNLVTIPQEAEATYESFGILCSNQGQFSRAIEMFKIALKISKWRTSDMAFNNSIALSFHVQILQDLDHILASNPGNPDIKLLGRQLLNEVPAYLDYRRSYLIAIGFNMSHTRDGLPRSIRLDFSDPTERALWARRFTIVESAHRSDLLRAFIAGYKVAAGNPPSLATRDAAGKTLKKELQSCNAITRPILANSGPMEMNSMEQSLEQVAIIRKRIE